MIEGGMDVLFLIVYFGQVPAHTGGFEHAYRQAVAKIHAVHRFTEIAPATWVLALTRPTSSPLHKKPSQSPSSA